MKLTLDTHTGPRDIEIAPADMTEYQLALFGRDPEVKAYLASRANGKRYAEDQPRDEHGRWSDGGGAVGEMVKETVAQGGTSVKLGDKGKLLRPSTGYMVSVPGGITPTYEAMTGPAGPAILRGFMDAHADALNDPNTYLGLWHDTAHGEIAVDISVNVQNRAEAVALGVQHNQQAIFDIAAGDVIDTGGTGGRAARLREAIQALGRDDGRGEGRLDRGRPDFAAYGLRFDDNEPRDEHGRWTSGGAIETTTTYSELDAKGQARVDARMEKAGVTSEQLVNEISSRCTDQAIAQYGDWYGKGHEMIGAMAERTGTTVERATAVVAVTSPAMGWEQNQQAANSILSYVQSGEADGLTGAQAYAKWADATPTTEGRWNLFSAQGSKAFDVALGNKEPADVLTTAKVSSFYDNLLEPGATREVTVDRHMLKAFGFATDGAVSQTQAENLYSAGVVENKVTTVQSVGAVAIAEAVRSVSAAKGVAPDAIQATYWSLVLDTPYPKAAS